MAKSQQKNTKYTIPEKDLGKILNLKKKERMRARLIKFDSDLEGVILQIAKSQNTNFSDIVRQALEQWLEEKGLSRR